MKFSEMPDGTLFRYKGELMVKRSALTYVSAENPLLGEMNIDGYTDKNIEPVETTAKQAETVNKNVNSVLDGKVVQAGEI